MKIFTNTCEITPEIANSDLGTEIQILDNINGFDRELKTEAFELIKHQTLTVWTQYMFSDQVKVNYPNLNFKCDAGFTNTTSSHHVLASLLPCNYISTHKDFKNFVCSFNGAHRPDRLFLTAILYKMGWFNSNYCSKNFSYSKQELDMNLSRIVAAQEYQSYITSDSGAAFQFYQTIIGFDYVSWEHANNINILYNKINNSFVQLVGETLATSYHPFVSEKFIQPIVCKSLWVAYAQPGYYAYLEKYYGFKKYDKLFDYSFDSIEHPVERLVAIIKMLSKYANLSPAEWHDLYLTELETIEYNYNQYFSQNYLTQIINADQ